MFAHHEVMLWVSLVMIGLCMPCATNLSTALIAAKFPRQNYIRAIAIVLPVQSVVRCCAFSILAFGLSGSAAIPELTSYWWALASSRWCCCGVPTSRQ